MSNTTAIILAAGKGSRMGSKKPKTLHQIGGKTMLDHVVLAAKHCCQEIIVVYGYGGDQVQEALAGSGCLFTEQKKLRGTGDAVRLAMPMVSSENVLILYGDVPLITAQTLDNLCLSLTDASLSLLTMNLDNPFGYGRIVRNFANNPMKIIEEHDANNEQKLITEVNTGILSAKHNNLQKWLDQLTDNNNQKEFYLTDIVEHAFADNEHIDTHLCSNNDEVRGVNDLQQLAQLERIYQKKIALAFLNKGVVFKDPDRVDFRGDVEIAAETTVDVNVIFAGTIKIGANCVIESGCVIKDSQIDDKVHIKANSLIDGATIEKYCTIGPFARIRPESKLAQNVSIGNFVEVKKSTLSEHTKVNHLSYVGDAIIGKNVNIGAGTITCNYDGKRKHKTIIGEGVFIGSGTELIAPIEIGSNAFVGAGSTLSKNVPSDLLSLTRSAQKNLKKRQSQD